MAPLVHDWDEFSAGAGRQMLTEEAVEACLTEGRNALALLSDLLSTGGRSSSEVCVRTRAELDVLVCLLEESP